VPTEASRTDHRRPAGRYDSPPLLLQRTLAVFLAVTVTALAGAVAVALWERATQERVTGRVLGYKVLSDSAVQIRLEVAKRSGGRAFCVIRARSADGREVGRDVAEVDSAGTTDRQRRASYTLSTTARAVTGEVAGCSPQPISKADHEQAD
jgi:hypothetical protein